MIDWLTLRVLGVEGDFHAGRFISVDRDGNVEWQTLKRLDVVGSHESRVYVRTVSHCRKGEFFPGSLEISGNPAKWFQGHNVWGSDELRQLVEAFVLRVCSAAAIPLGDQALRLLQEGIVPLTRVDVTESWEFGSAPRALSAIRALSEFGHMRHRGRGSLFSDGTVYFGKGSRRVSAKLYAKGPELAKHSLPDALRDRERIESFAAGLVRAEFTLRSMWLRDKGLDLLQNWGTKGVTPSQLHAELMANLNVSEATIRDPEYLEELPARLRLAYDAWRTGADLRAMLPARTFYRYRSQLLPHGVDIAVKQAGRDQTNVVPLRVVLVGKPVGVPDWARDTPLYFDPATALRAA